jgi:hypothetical protein
MTSRFTELVIDCANPRVLAEFWSAALGYTVIAEQEDQVEIAAYEPTIETVIRAPGPATLLFIRVPEGKQRKNRLHLDLSPVDRSRDAEVARLVALGAIRVNIGQGERDWVVLADPEGNEFCVLRALTDRMPSG